MFAMGAMKIGGIGWKTFGSSLLAWLGSGEVHMQLAVA
jgi:hypothetical protein